MKLTSLIMAILMASFFVVMACQVDDNRHTLSDSEAKMIFGGNPGWDCGSISDCWINGPYFCSGSSSTSCNIKE